MLQHGYFGVFQAIPHLRPRPLDRRKIRWLDVWSTPRKIELVGYDRASRRLGRVGKIGLVDKGQKKVLACTLHWQ